jgi:nitrite reductase (cytochrome c-552)
MKAFFIAGAAAIGAAIAAKVLVSIFEHKVEAKNPFYRVVELTDRTEDPAIWGQNFPLQYDDYRKTVDQTRTRFGGSEAVPHVPTDADPRTVTSQSKLDEDPRLKTIWAGYAFSKDFREERGHGYMLIDQIYTERQKFVQQPGTCINCHASTYVPMMELGHGDLMHGFEILNKMPYQEARQHVQHPVACIDCHDPTTMQLRVTRPAFMEGIKAYKASQGIADYDVNKSASRQEMRAFVCGQCHVEYYFKGPEKRLTFPWAKGIKADEILAYYEGEGFKDWVHKDTDAPVLKAQHPEFEMWNQGVHAQSGVTCADCHMPYKRVGASKISDHHVQSPLLNISAACQNCHHFPESELMSRVLKIQSTHMALRDVAMNAVVALITDLKAAKDGGMASEKLLEVGAFQKKAQFLLDFVEAENSSGFHAPQEAARLLGYSIDYARQGQEKLAKIRETR